MVSLAQISHSTAIALVISISYCIRCTPDSPERTKPLRRYRTIPEALNYLYELLGDQMPVSEKCKRYAIILALTASGLYPFQPTIDQLSALPEDTVNEHYRKMGAKRLSALYMSAIDRYRTSRLGLPFLELIECLRQIDGRMLDKYLDNKELKIIIYLYRQALGSPDKQIDLDDFELRHFSPAFRASLHSILRDYLKSKSCMQASREHETSENPATDRTGPMAIISKQCAGANESDTGPSSSMHLPRKSLKISETLSVKRNQQRAQLRISKLLQGGREQPGPPEIAASNQYGEPRGRPRILNEQEREERRECKRRRDRERERKLRRENPVYYREQARLRQRRCRLLKSGDDRLEEARRKQEGHGQLRQRRLGQQLLHLSQLKQIEQKDLQSQLDQFLSARLSPNLMALEWPVSDQPFSATDSQLQPEQPQRQHRFSQVILNTSIEAIRQSPPGQMNLGKKPAVVKPTVICPRTFLAPAHDQIDPAHFDLEGQVDDSRTLVSERKGESDGNEIQAHAEDQADNTDCQSVDIEAILFQSPKPGEDPLEFDSLDPFHEYDRQMGRRQ